MSRIAKVLIPLGMVGVVFYFIHTFLGNILWTEYDPLRMDISSLTADGAPNAPLLKIFTLMYGICMVLMAAGLVLHAFNKYNRLLKVGFVILLIMQLTPIIGYGLFPLTGDKTEMNFQNMMHYMVTVIVVFTTIASSFTIARGLSKQESTKRMGKIALFFAITITVFGMLNPISMGLDLNLLGLTERLVIYTIQTFLFVLSFYHTFYYEKAEVVS